VDAEGHGQWFGAAAIQELPIGWPWPHECVFLAQITRLPASTKQVRQYKMTQFIKAQRTMLLAELPHISAQQ